MAKYDAGDGHYPDATAERYACAEATDRLRVNDAKYACSIRGKTIPQAALAPT